MKVKVLSNINSGQYTAGQVVDFSDEEAEQLIEAGAAVAFDQTGEQAEAEQPDQADQAQAQDAETVSQPNETAGDAQEVAPPPAPLAEAQPPQPPTESSAQAGVSPTAEQIAQDVASIESKPEVSEV